MLVDLIYSLKAGYRQNAVFVMNRKTQAAIRKFKDSQGNYLWQPPAQANGSATLSAIVHLLPPLVMVGRPGHRRLRGGAEEHVDARDKRGHDGRGVW